MHSFLTLTKRNHLAIIKVKFHFSLILQFYFYIYLEKVQTSKIKKYLHNFSRFKVHLSYLSNVSSEVSIHTEFRPNAFSQRYNMVMNENEEIKQK